MIELLIGMVASGKSTYARQRADQGALVVNHDDLTAMLHARYRYEPALRAIYRGMMLQIARLAVVAGRDVIVDRTHLTLEARRLWIDAAASWMTPVVAVEFPTFDPAVHARRRFQADPRGRSYADWLQVAQHHYAQALAEPLGPDEGFAEIRTHCGATATEAGAVVIPPRPVIA